MIVASAVLLVTWSWWQIASCTEPYLAHGYRPFNEVPVRVAPVAAFLRVGVTLQQCSLN